MERQYEEHGAVTDETSLRQVAHGPLTLEVGSEAETCIVRLDGELDLESAPALERELERLLANGRTSSITLDVAGLTFIDSIGLHCLLRGARSARGSGRELRVRSPRGQVEHVLRLTGLRNALLFAT